jgi:hypothetical protein
MKGISETTRARSVTHYFSMCYAAKLLCKHLIVTFLGQPQRSEERSELGGYDQRRLFCARVTHAHP